MTSDDLPHQVRMEMAQFLQHTLDERAAQVRSPLIAIDCSTLSTSVQPR